MQLAPLATFTPLPPTLKLPAPAAPVIVGVPPHALATFGVAAITRPTGNVSLKVSPVRAGAPAGFVIVKVSVATCPMPIVPVEKALVSVARGCTVRLDAVTALARRASALMLPAALVYGPPGTLEVTSTVTRHEGCAAFIEALVTVIVPLPGAAVTTPVPDGHVVVTFGAAATTTLAGNVSVKLMPDSAGLPGAFVSVKVSVAVPPTSMDAGLNALLSEAWPTVRVWVVTPFTSTPPTVTCAAPFTKLPVAAAETSTDTVQVEAPAAAFTPEPPIAKVPAPATAVTVGAPPQLFTTFGVAAITSPPGSASLKVSPVRAGELAGLAMVKVSVEAWPCPTVAGTKALVSTGWPCTVRLLEVTALVTRAVAVMFAAALVYGPPCTLEVTSTVITHEACAADIEAPVTVTVEPAATAATAPVPEGHVVVTFGTAATTTFAGSVSVKLIPDCAGLPAPFASVNVSVEVPPTSIAVSANALLSEAWTIVRVWLVTPLLSVPPTVTWAAPFT